MEGQDTDMKRRTNRQMTRRQKYEWTDVQTDQGKKFIHIAKGAICTEIFLVLADTGCIVVSNNETRRPT